MAYKRMNEYDDNKWLIEQYLSSPWLTMAEVEQLKIPLPIALNLGGLYEQMLKALMPIPANEGENIKAHTERLSLITQKQKEIAQLERKMRNAKQFNRKVEMNSQIKTLLQQLEQLQA